MVSWACLSAQRPQLETLLKRRLVLRGFLVLWTCLTIISPSRAEDSQGLSRGQTVYVPAYSHIYAGNREQPFLLTVTLSIRNIDPLRPITVTKIDYYETQGKFLKGFLDGPVVLKPLESARYIIPEKDKAGGSGANFIVEWESGAPANPPIVESVMIGTQTQQGISFTSRGRVVLPPD
ncbi:MAG: DUF3124 domain-containing protein [Proteobacteria bacterium]|nr:DUF3124 domain-containing protein [Pseudomonadota bacterium]